MSRIPYAEPDILSEEARSILASSSLNITRMMVGASPRVARGFTEFAGAFYRDSTLPPRLREIAILRVGHLLGSSYEVYQHQALAREIGISDHGLAAIAGGAAAAGSLGEDEAAVMIFADDLVRHVRASDEALASVSRYLDRRQVLDLILVIGLYMMVCRFLETTGVEQEASPFDWREALSG